MMNDPKILNRLKRSEGQIRGIIRMIEEERTCREVITQLTAVRSSIDKVIGLIVAENLISCMENETGDQKTNIEEAVQLLLKSR